MTSFQHIALGAMLLLALASAAGLIRHRSRSSAFWLLLALVAGAAIVWPESTVAAARLLGIGRGADLVFYGATLTMVIGFFVVYLRLRQTKRQLTLIIRHLAIQGAEEHIDAVLSGEAEPTCAAVSGNNNENRSIADASSTVG